ncbi:hypothetical protein L1987_20391 [Smallanthus sonchifolius]|uniref:Uncharacterized protein n=1 Tax=Smallanthus sonchifolius TaxID=185202 RepID=A0ACB9IS62_9ASTR|nr:hypothetical protein L1987_20391 [Smallanthus sonchifolius]
MMKIMRIRMVHKVSYEDEVEVEFEKVDEEVHYKTIKGLEFDANFVEQVGNTEPEEDKEEGEVGEEEKSVQDEWAEKKNTWWKTVPETPQNSILKTKFISKGKDIGRIVSWL